jgi:hypothetical protein
LQMVDMFKMSDLGLLTYYLGIEVKQDDNGIFLPQGNYGQRILENGVMEDCNSCEVPMEPKLKLRKESNTPLVNATEYRSLVGSLRYMVNTRPDLALVVGYVSRYTEEPHEEHLATVKHILRFIAGTKRQGLLYPRTEEGSRLIGYSDSDLAGDLDSRESTSGIMFFLGDSLVSWQSTKQRVVALSSCEVEYIAAATRAYQAVWLAHLLSEMMDNEVSVPMLRIDNKPSVSD